MCDDVQTLGHMSGQDHVEVLYDHTLSRGECCVQAQELHPVGTVIGHELSEDNCTEVTVTTLLHS